MNVMSGSSWLGFTHSVTLDRIEMHTGTYFTGHNYLERAINPRSVPAKKVVVVSGFAE
jgi:hypothetical protein